MAVAPGTRVMLRYRLPPGYSHPMTDVIGELVEVDENVVAVRAGDGRVVRVARDRVVVMKALGPRPIRTSEIRSLERAAADGWPGLEQAWIGGWLLRYGRGFTGRANSALPVEPHADESSLGEIAAWFRDRGQWPKLLLPDRLGTVPAGWTTGYEVMVMAADITSVVVPSDSISHIAAVPDEDWRRFYHYRGRAAPEDAMDVVSAVRDGVVGFARIGNSATEILAIGRAAVTTAPDLRRWVGLTAIEVSENHRRHGLGTRICGELLAWGVRQRATHAYLQVLTDNLGALAMYRELGFVEHHRYRYAEPPR